MDDASGPQDRPGAIDLGPVKDKTFEHGYRSASDDPRELRPRSANRAAALALIGALVVVIVLIAVFN